MTIESMKKILAMPSIGNFKCIELFEVIGIKDSNPPFNIFSLAVAHETDLPLTEKEEITPKLIKLKADKSLKFGVVSIYSKLFQIKNVNCRRFS